MSRIDQEINSKSMSIVDNYNMNILCANCGYRYAYHLSVDNRCPYVDHNGNVKYNTYAKFKQSKDKE